MLHKFLRTIRANSQDPYFKQVSLLLHGDGTNGSQNNTFIDSSTNNLSITRYNNATQGTFSPFSQDAGYWSNFFDGTNDRLTIADNANLRAGTSNFTIEAWIYRAASGAAHTIFAKGASTPTGFAFLVTSTNVLRFTNTSSNIDSTGTIPANTWTHVAAVREGTGSNQFKLYINGVNDGTGTVSTNYNQTDEARIGENRGATDDFNGYISNLRLVIGTAVYTATFTPPTAPLTAITNTSLLTCQSNRFVDNSSNNFTVTRVNNTSVQAFSPFAPTSAYSSSVNGASGYFDGTLDRLNASGTPLEIMGTGNFTFECYVYLTGTIGSTGYSMLMSQDDGSSGNQGFQLGVSTNLAIRFLWWTGSLRSTAVSLITSNNAVSINSWNHVAVSWDGTTLRIFVNGSVAASTTSFSPFNSGTSLTGIGNYTGTFSGAGLFGYLASVRIVKGTAVYTATFTPPTEPLTDITNTSLLLNFTNAGIFDNTMKNDLETLGNAQVSTSVTKFGTGSMKFDGSGDSLLGVASPSFAFGTGDYTVEYWVYPASFSNQPTMFDTRPASSSVNGYADFFSTTGLFKLYIGNTNIYTSSTTISTNTWTHIAVSRSGTSLRVFINGVQDGSTVTNSTNMTDTQCRVGNNINGSASLNGYIDDLRVTKGVARYTANFTPPSAPYPNS